jgi:hypothetical protein
MSMKTDFYMETSITQSYIYILVYRPMGLFRLFIDLHKYKSGDLEIFKFPPNKTEDNL